jgi:Domain of unknown function (DUF309)
MTAAHHEEMVAVWNRTQSHLYRGLMILAAAFVHLERGNPEGARIKFRKAREHLSPLNSFSSFSSQGCEMGVALLTRMSSRPAQPVPAERGLLLFNLMRITGRFFQRPSKC